MSEENENIFSSEQNSSSGNFSNGNRDSNSKFNFYFDRRHCKETALNQLSGRWGTPILALVLTFVILAILFISFFPWGMYIDMIKMSAHEIDTKNFSFDDMKPFIIRFSLSIIIFLIAMPIFTFANEYFYLKMFSTKEKIPFSTFIEGFSFFGKALRGKFYLGFRVMLWAMIPAIPTMILDFIFSDTPIFVLFHILGCIAMSCVIVMKTIEYGQIDFLLLDNKDIGVIEALKKSSKITYGYKKNIFVFELSFIGWKLLARYFSLVNLYLIPYKTMADVNVYQFLKRADEEIEKKC